MEQLEDRIKKLEEENRILHAQFDAKGYIPQDIASECLEMLKPLDVMGEPNTLWALVKKAMKTIEIWKAEFNETLHKLNRAVELFEELTRGVDDDGGPCWCDESPCGDNYEKRGITKHEPQCIDIKELMCSENKCSKHNHIRLTYDTWNRPMCWLLWGLRENGLVELRSVSLTEKHATAALESAKHEIEFYSDQSKFNPTIRVWNEQRQAEHIYGASIAGEMMALASMTIPKPK